jgi:small subunit ribosomal protein S2
MTDINLSNLPDKAPEYDLRDLLEAGCHFGHQRNKWNPKMEEYIYADKEGVHVFDLAKTAEQLQLAYNYFYQLGKLGKTVIMVGTKRHAREVVEKVAQESGMMYIASRWLGGFLTNWEQIKKSLDSMIKMQAAFKAGEYDDLTKFEQSQLKKEITRLERFFEGIRDLKSHPDAIFVVDPVKEKIAVKEANLVDVPVVGIVDSNADPDLLEIPIPANDDAAKSVAFIVEEIGKAYLAGSEAK